MATAKSDDDVFETFTDTWTELIGQAILFNDMVAETLGLSPRTLQTFGIICRHDGPMFVTEVARRSRLPASSTTRVLDRLEAGGYITRRSIAADRRKIAVEPVAARVSDVAGHYTSKTGQLRDALNRRARAEIDVILAFLEDLAQTEPGGI